MVGWTALPIIQKHNDYLRKTRQLSNSDIQLNIKIQNNIIVPRPREEINKICHLRGKVTYAMYTLWYVVQVHKLQVASTKRIANVISPHNEK